MFGSRRGLLEFQIGYLKESLKTRISTRGRLWAVTRGKFEDDSIY